MSCIRCKEELGSQHDPKCPHSGEVKEIHCPSQIPVIVGGFGFVSMAYYAPAPRKSRGLYSGD